MTPEELCDHVRWSLSEAHEGRSKLDTETLSIGGFSTPLQRRLMNNLCSKARTYLEIGLFRGATFCAAACGNKELGAIGVENFAQPFGEQGVEENLRDNIRMTLPKCGDMVLIDQDCWTWDQSGIIRKAEVGTYDGEHSLENQSRALPHFLKSMADTFVWVVDDFSWPDVQNGTKNGFELLKAKIKIVGEWCYHVTANDHPLYHNGLGIFVIQKV